MELRQLLLLVQDQRDVAALPGAAAAYVSQGFNGLWVLFSPAVLVDTAAAAAEKDRDIAALNAQIDACAKSRDFVGAQQYQAQLDGKLLDRAAAVKDAWKTLSPDQQKVATERVFGAFFEALPKERVRPEMMREHYEANEFIAALNAHKKGWFAPYSPGDFTMVWARELAKWSGQQPAKLVAPEPTIAQEAVATVKRILAQRKPMPTEHPRFKELVMMGLDGIGAHALTLGINPNGQNILKLRHAVFKKEKEMGLVA